MQLGFKNISQLWGRSAHQRTVEFQSYTAQVLGHLSRIAAEDTRLQHRLLFMGRVHTTISLHTQGFQNHSFFLKKKKSYFFFMVLPGSEVLTYFQDTGRAMHGAASGKTHTYVLISTSPHLPNSPFLLGTELMTHSSRRNFLSPFLSCWEANFIQSVLPFYLLNGL